MEAKKVTILYFSEKEKNCDIQSNNTFHYQIIPLSSHLSQQEYQAIFSQCEGEDLLVLNTDDISDSQIPNLLANYYKEKKKRIYYGTPRLNARFSGFIEKNLKMISPEILNASFLIGEKSLFANAYAGNELSGHPIRNISFSLQKSFARFRLLSGHINYQKNTPHSHDRAILLNYRYSIKLPFHYLMSGNFFREFFRPEGWAQRNMVSRMLMICFALFTLFYMPYISKDFGITGDEFVDQRHAGYVLNYYLHGDKAAVYQPKTFLHFYGISMQVITEGICQLFNADDYFAVRHAMTALFGAMGIWFTGLLALRWGGGLCGLLAMLLLFFTPRYFGHSMNNMKDIPFAAGYIMSLFYIIRLFDFYPYFRLRYLLGAVSGIALTFSTRSGGLVLYPYLLMYAGLFYILQVGIKEFYKFYKYREDVSRIFTVILITFVFSYLLSIALWPYALEHPVSGISASLKQFTNFTVALRLMFNGKEIMSNMVPSSYIPTFLAIGLPVILLAGFIGYLCWILFKRKEFSLISWFLLFAAIFPIAWVMYKNSNLYGGVRHFLFVISVLAVISARYWTLLIQLPYKTAKIIFICLFAGLLSLPLTHMVRNHPHEYVYFNEIIGGIKGAYGKFDTDYYFNSLKHSTAWFKKNIELPKDRKTIIMTNLEFPLSQYFKKDTNVQVIYSRYYEKYSKDWDYAIVSNEYINPYQLEHGLFPPKGTIYAPSVDGYAVGAVIKRENKEELKAFRLERERKNEEALKAFEQYYATHPDAPEEVLSRMGKLCYLSGHIAKAREFLNMALQKHPLLNEALYMSVLTYIAERDYPSASGEVQKMLANNSSSANAYYLRAQVYSHQKKYQEAINDLNRTLAYMPKNTSALFLAGDILRINGNYQQAINIYRRVIAITPDIRAFSMIAECYCKMKNYPEMEKLLTQILQNNPGYYPAYKIKIRSLLQQNAWGEAAKILNQLQQINNDAEIFVLRAWYLKATNKPQEAMQMIHQALQLDPEDQEAQKMKQEIH